MIDIIFTGKNRTLLVQALVPQLHLPLSPPHRPHSLSPQNLLMRYLKIPRIPLQQYHRDRSPRRCTLHLHHRLCFLHSTIKD